MAQIGGMSVSTDPDAGIAIYYKDNIAAGEYIYGVNTSKEWTGSKIHGIYGKVIYTGWFHTKGIWERECRWRTEDKDAFQALDADGFVFANPTWLDLVGGSNSWMVYNSLSPGADKWINSTSHPGTGNYSAVNKLSDAWTVDFADDVMSNQIDCNMSENVTERKAFVGVDNELDNPLRRLSLMTDIKYECKTAGSNIACVTVQLPDPGSDIDDWNSKMYLQWNGDSAAQTITKQGSEHYVISLFADCGSVARCKINKLTSSSVDIDHPGQDNIILSIWKS